MKIRIKGNTLRLRLTRTEVAQFAEKDYIEERTDFGGAYLTYALKSYEGDAIAASFENGTITMLLPQAMKTEWTGTERVGFEGNMPVAEGRTLYLLLEKDFKCLDENIGDQSDNYDNPLFAKQ
jgi:hypothetical protein